MNYSVRKMSDKDAYYTALIEKECFSRPWNEKNFIDSLHNGTGIFFVAECEGNIVGFTGADDIGGEVYISNIAVTEKYRKNGIGSLLIKNMLDYCKENNSDFITLEVRVSNKTAIDFYSSFGFENLGIRKNFYTEPCENAYIMTKYFERND